MVSRTKIASSALALAVATVGAWTFAQQSPPATTPYFDPGTPPGTGQPPMTSPATPTPTPTPVAPTPQQPPLQTPPVQVGPADAAPPVQPPPNGNDPANAPAQPPVQQAPAFTPQELDGLLAPVALYPDALLSQVLMASTYPLEVVQARRFVDGNPNLQGQQLADVLAAQPWDPSVKSLVNTPTVLRLMDDKLDWTVRLGNAFIAQQPEVMDSVQRLRVQAQQAGYLNDDAQRRVTTVPPPPPPPQVVVQTEPPPPPVIVIEETSPEYVYVPVYDPGVVYGGWRHPAHRPFFWRPYNYVSTGVFFYDRPCRVGPAWSYAWGRPDWRDRRIDLDLRRARADARVERDESFRRIRERENSGVAQPNRSTWQHDTRHRLGVAYRDADTARRVTQQQQPNRTTDDRQRTRPDVGNGVAGVGPARPDSRTRSPDRTLPDTAMTNRNDRQPARPDRPQVQADTSPTPAERARAERAAREAQQQQQPTRPDNRPAATPRTPDATPKPQATPKPNAAPKPQATPTPPAAPRTGDRPSSDGTARPSDPDRQRTRPTPDAKPSVPANPPSTPQPRRDAQPDARPQETPRRQPEAAPQPKPEPRAEPKAEPRPAPRREPAPETPAPRREAPAPQAPPRVAPPPPATPAPSRGSAPERPAPAPQRPAPAPERPAPAPERVAPERPAPSVDRGGNSGSRNGGESRGSGSGGGSSSGRTRER